MRSLRIAFPMLFLILVPFAQAQSPRVPGLERPGASVVSEATPPIGLALPVILRTAPSGIGMVKNRVIVMVNDYILHLLGYVEEDLLGKNARIFYPSDEEYEFVGAEKYRQIAEYGTGSVETRWVTRDGRVLNVILSSTPLDPNDLSVGVIFTVQNITDVRKAEGALRESEIKFRSFFQNNPALMALSSYPERQFIEVNGVFLDTMGYTRDEVIGRTSEELGLFVSPDQLERVAEHLISTGRFFGMGMRVKRKDGTILDGLFSGDLIEISGRKYFLTVMVDISETKRIEEALRESEERYRELVENANSIILRMDEEGKVTFFNEFAQRFFGYTSEEIIGRNVVGTIVPETDYAGRDLRAMILDIGLHPELYAANENENIRRDGSRVWVAWTNKPLFDTNGELREILCIGNDITGRKRAEEALRESEERYRSIIRVSNTGAWEYHKESDYLWCSPEYFEMLGLDPAKFRMDGGVNLKEAWIDLIHPEDRERASQLFADYLASGSKGIYENYFRMLHADGGYVWIWSRGQTLRNPDGTLTDLTVGTHIDITERERAAVQIQNRTQVFLRTAIGFIVLLGVLLVLLTYLWRAGRRNQKALRESEALLARSQEIAKLGSWKLDLATNRLTWSDEVYRLFGCKPKAFAATYEAFLDFVHPDDRASVDDAYSTSLREGSNGYEIEHRIIRKDTGEVRHVREQCVHERDFTGAIIQSIGMVQDITEHKRAEEILRESEEKNRALLSALPDLIFIFDRDGVFLDCKATKDSDFLISPKIFLNKSVEDILPKEIAERTRYYIDEVLETGKQQVYEYPLEMNGELRHYESRMVALGQEKTLAIIRDITERKRSEEALRESEESLRLQIERMPIGCVIWDHEFRVMTWNPAAEKIFGYTSEEAIGRHPYEIIVPGEVQSAIDEIWRRLLEGDTTAHSLNENYTKDGRQIVCHWTNTPLKRPDGSILGVLSMVEDVTERLKAEESLRDERERLAGILRGTNVGTWEWNVQTGELILNDRWADIIGYTLDEISPVSVETWGKYCHPNDLKVSNELLGKHFRGELDYYECETRMKHKSGEWVWILDRGRVVTWTEDNKPLMMMGTHQDITERKRAEETIRMDEERLETLLKLSQMTDSSESDLTHFAMEAAVRLTRSTIGYIAFANEDETVLTMYAWSRSAMRECAIEEKPIVYPVSATGLWGEAVRQRKPIITNDYAALNPLKKGVPIGHVHIARHMNIPIFDGDRIVIVAGVGNKLSDYGDDDVRQLNLLMSGLWTIIRRKRAEEEREKLQEQLIHSQKMESVGRLAGGVAHDFNNMLSVILGHTELAMEQVDPKQPLFEDLMEIQKAAERSAAITRQLLGFARKQTVAPRVLDLNETVEGMLKMLRRLIGEDVVLTWLPRKNLSPIKIDPSQIDQMLANLCLNARDAIENVGKITIETGTASFDQAYCVENTGFLPGEYVMLAVSDDGCGMDKETLAHIFEPFFTTKEVGEGTGLGLATVYGIVKQNNGFINVYSEPGEGTTFRIYLPQYLEKTERTLEKKDSMESPSRGKEWILLVEDEPTILKMTKAMLEHLGYSVLPASSPGEAIRLAEMNADRIDLLITDVVMPEMNGRDLAKNLLDLYPNLSRLFMSGYTADVIAHRGILDPGVQYIQKPFSLKDLAAKIREVLDYK